MRNNRKSKWIVRAYNEVSGEDVDTIAKVPQRSINYFLLMPFEAIVTPFVIKRLNLKDSIQTVSTNYDIEFHIVRRIRNRLKIGK